MYGIFTYISHRNQPNVGKYTLHRWYGIGFYGIDTRQIVKKKSSQKADESRSCQMSEEIIPVVCHHDHRLGENAAEKQGG